MLAAIACAFGHLGDAARPRLAARPRRRPGRRRPRGGRVRARRAPRRRRPRRPDRALRRRRAPTSATGRRSRSARSPRTTAPALRDALAARLDDPDEDTRLEAVHGLAVRGDPRAEAPARDLLAAHADAEGEGVWTRHLLAETASHLDAAKRLGAPRAAPRGAARKRASATTRPAWRRGPRGLGDRGGLLRRRGGGRRAAGAAGAGAGRPEPGPEPREPEREPRRRAPEPRGGSGSLGGAGRRRRSLGAAAGASSAGRLLGRRGASAGAASSGVGRGRRRSPGPARARASRWSGSPRPAASAPCRDGRGRLGRRRRRVVVDSAASRPAARPRRAARAGARTGRRRGRDRRSASGMPSPLWSSRPSVTLSPLVSGVRRDRCRWPARPRWHAVAVGVVVAVDHAVAVGVAAFGSAADLEVVERRHAGSPAIVAASPASSGFRAALVLDASGTPSPSLSPSVSKSSCARRSCPRRRRGRRCVVRAARAPLLGAGSSASRSACEVDGADAAAEVEAAGVAAARRRRRRAGRCRSGPSATAAPDRDGACGSAARCRAAALQLGELDGERRRLLRQALRASPSSRRAARRSRPGRVFRRRGRWRSCPRIGGLRGRWAARRAPSWRKCCQCPTCLASPSMGSVGKLYAVH